MIARRHHYVPRCYLKGFSVARKKRRQVVVFDCKSGKSFATATENIAVEKDFNRVEVEGHPPDVLEKAMSEFESEVASALERIIAAIIRQIEFDLAKAADPSEGWARLPRPEPSVRARKPVATPF